MAEIVTGYDTSNLVVTVANNDVAMNGDIAAKNAIGFLVVEIILSGTDVIILYTKTAPISI